MYIKSKTYVVKIMLTYDKEILLIGSFLFYHYFCESEGKFNNLLTISSNWGQLR